MFLFHGILRKLGRRLPRSWKASIYRFISRVLDSLVPMLGLRRGVYTCSFACLPGRRFKMSLDLSDRLQRKIYLTGNHEPNATTLYCQILNKGMTAVDVGAHVGWYTIIASHLVREGGNVLAFEPDPTNACQLAETIKANSLHNVRLYRYALGESNETVELNLATDSSAHSLGRSEVTDGFFKGGIGGAGRTVSVACTTLDDVLEARTDRTVDLVKIDVEGAELLVLRGMRRVIKENSELYIFCDVHENKFPAFGYKADDLYDFLDHCGLRVFILQADGSVQLLQDLTRRPSLDLYTIIATKREGIVISNHE